ncbi:MAG: alpha/beta hydrolase-fold protein [Saprospiraceae bacterium]
MLQFLKRLYKSFFFGAAISSHAQDRQVVEIETGIEVIRILNFQSNFVEPRNIEIFLPKNFGSDTAIEYNILFWQDGQNLFDANVAYNANPLEMHKAIDRLNIENLIVIGIWNTDKRYREYLPEKIYNNLSKTQRVQLKLEYSGKPISDDYLKFIVDELNPFIKNQYLQNIQIASIGIGGCSMGALISLYAVLEYPNMFDFAICMSTHWPLSVLRNNPEVHKSTIKYIQQSLGNNNYKFYFDYGTENLDAWYEGYQIQVDTLLSNKANVSFQTIKFNGDSHSELDWRKRLEMPLKFMLGK